MKKKTRELLEFYDWRFKGLDATISKYRKDYRALLGFLDLEYIPGKYKDGQRQQGAYKKKRKEREK